MVTPQALYTKHHAQELAQFAELETKIDEYLDAHFKEYGQSIVFTPPANTLNAVLHRLAQKYRANGWQVAVMTSQRDGTDLEFKASDPNP